MPADGVFTLPDTLTETWAEIMTKGCEFPLGSVHILSLGIGFGSVT